VVAFRYLQRPPPGGEPSDPPQPLWPGGASRYGGCFTPVGGADTIYLASDSDTASREAQAVLQPTGGPPVTIVRAPWVVISVEDSLSGVLDLTDPDVQDLLGTSLAELTGVWQVAPPRRKPPTHLLGRLGYDAERIVAIHYVSAKHPAHGRCVAVFADRLVSGRPSYLRTVDPYTNLAQRLP
jgi:RES domain-containing protein